MEREPVDGTSPPQTLNYQRPDSDRHDLPRVYDNEQCFKRGAYPPPPHAMDRSYEQSAHRRKYSLHEQDAYSRQPLKQAVMHPHTQEYLPMEPRSRHRAHPSQEVIDLTCSPRRPPFGNACDLYTAPQGYPVYVPDSQHRTAVRHAYHDQTAGARPHAYMPEHDRTYERRAPPAPEYIPMRR